MKFDSTNRGPRCPEILHRILSYPSRSEEERRTHIHRGKYFTDRTLVPRLKIVSYILLHFKVKLRGRGSYRSTVTLRSLRLLKSQWRVYSPRLLRGDGSVSGGGCESVSPGGIRPGMFDSCFRPEDRDLSSHTRGTRFVTGS